MRSQEFGHVAVVEFVGGGEADTDLVAVGVDVFGLGSAKELFVADAVGGGQF